MFDVKKVRKDFPMLEGKSMQGKPLIYLDNGATTFKPYAVVEAVSEYYKEYTANAHRGDYDLSHIVDVHYEDARKTVAEFIGADAKEVVFTSGASASLNMVAFGVGEKWLNEGDEVLICESEHASNVLPWYKLAESKGIVVKYIPLNEDGRVTAENLRTVISEKTKVVSVAQISNVLGYINDVKALGKVAHEYGAFMIVDACQSAPHMKLDVKDLDCDFLCFSAHKMCGPTGVGIMYGKYDLLDKINPLMMGGGMNTRFDTCGVYHLQKPPYKFEAGTPHIEGALGMAAAVKYLQSLGMDAIHEYELELRRYAMEKLSKLDNIEIYNKNADTGIITFNIKNVFAQDAATHYNANGIAIRAGQHCAKILNNFLGTVATCRMSLYFYNTKEEIDKFVEVTAKGDDFLDAFFA